MATVKKYNLQGQEVGVVDLHEAFLNVTVSSQMVKDYVVALRANARQWTASTKGRSEVNHSTRKPHAQKGGGRSRQGSLVAPQYKGGGRVFTPRPKFDQHIRINQKERRAAIRYLIGEKIQNETLFVLQDSAMDKPATKVVHNFLKTVTDRRRTLFLLEGAYDKVQLGEEQAVISVCSDKHQNVKKSIRNLEKVECLLARDVSGYDVVSAQNLIITEEALKDLTTWLIG